MAVNQGSSGAGVGDEMRQFAGRVGRVGHDFYGASPHRGQAGDEKLNGVLAHDQDSVAPADTTLHHPSCEAGDAVLQLSVGDRLVPHTYGDLVRSEEHTSELQSLMRISYAVFCLKKK